MLRRVTALVEQRLYMCHVGGPGCTRVLSVVFDSPARRTDNAPYPNFGGAILSQKVESSLFGCEIRVVDVNQTATVNLKKQ